MDKGMLSPIEVAQALGVCAETVARWRRKGIGPVAVRVGPRLWRYPAEGLEAYRRQQVAGGAQ